MDLPIAHEQGSPAHPFWVLPKRLAGLRRPESAAELRALQGLGVGLLVSLTEAPLPQPWLQGLSMQVLHRPCQNFGAPSMEQLTEVLPALDQALSKPGAAAVHCQFGRGRAGTLLSCYLVWRGIEPERALAHVRAIRSGAAAAEEQEALVYRVVDLRDLVRPTLPRLRLPNLDGEP